MTLVKLSNVGFLAADSSSSSPNVVVCLSVCLLSVIKLKNAC